MLPASPSCPMSPEKCVGLHGWVESTHECEKLCQDNPGCATYKLYNTTALCYLLSSCSPHVVTHRQCTLTRHNYLAVKLFTPSLAACKEHCEATAGCRYGQNYSLVLSIVAAGITTTTPYPTHLPLIIVTCTSSAMMRIRSQRCPW